MRLKPQYRRLEGTDEIEVVYEPRCRLYIDFGDGETIYEANTFDELVEDLLGTAYATLTDEVSRQARREDYLQQLRKIHGLEGSAETSESFIETLAKAGMFDLYERSAGTGAS